MRSLTSRERVMAAMCGEPVDRVANTSLVKQFCTRQLGLKFRDYNRDPQVLVESQLQTYERWPIDCFTALGFAYREASDCGLPLVWPEDTVPHPVGVLVNERADIGRLRWPAPWDGPLMSARLRAIQMFKKLRPDVAVFGAVEGCFAQALTFRGMQQAMEDLVLEPDLMRELMDFILPNEIAFAKAQVEAGADLIFVGESAASLVGRRPYVDTILPFERALIRAIQQMGVPAKLHICGNISHIMHDVAMASADIVDIDWMVSLTEARKVFGPQVCLCGNFDPVAILLQSTPEKVREECRRCIREAGTPFILAPGCEVPPDTPAANYAALCETYH